MLRFILDDINAKKICKRLVKILPSLITHVSDRYKTQEMCDKAIIENGGTLESFSDGYKN